MKCTGRLKKIFALCLFFSLGYSPFGIAQSGIITRQGKVLMRNGSPFKFVGFNAFTLTGCGNPNEVPSDAQIDAYFASLRPNSITRIWAFRNLGLTNIGRVINSAAAHGQMVVPVLADGRSGCGETDGAPNGDGSGKNPSWYQSGYLTLFKPWITQIVNQFKTSSAIGYWEIINEPDDAGNINVLKSFLNDCAATIKAADPGHLVSTGSWAEWAYGSTNANFQLIHSGPNIDIGTLHEYDYDYQNSRTIVSGHYQPCLDAMNALNKVLVIGEMGILANASNCLSTFQVRADAMKQKFDAYMQGASGALIWNWNLETADVGCNNNVKPSDPLIAVVHDYVIPGSTPPSGNLALNKPGTASSIEGTGFEPAKAFDGNATTTRWAAAFTGDPQWIYVDLGGTFSINHVVLKWETAYGKSYQIQVSSNASSWTNVFSTTTGDGGTDDITFTATNARYVRMFGTQRANTSFSYSIYEFEVYGTGDTQAPSVPTGLAASSVTQTSLNLSWNASSDNVGVTGYEVFKNGSSIATPTSTSQSVTGLSCNTSYSFTVRARDAAGNWSAQSAVTNVTTAACAATNLALNKPGTASSIQGTGFEASKAFDGNSTTTRWAANFTGDPQWIYVDLGGTFSINHVILKWETAYGKSYQIQVSSNASTWTNVFSTTTGDGGTDDITFAATSARYVRMFGTQRANTSFSYSLWEFEVYGVSGLMSLNTSALNSGTDLLNRKPSVRVFPNPVSDNNLRMRVTGYKQQDIYVIVFDITGRLLYERQYHINGFNQEIDIPSIKLAKGSYVVSVRSGENTQQEKFIVR